MLSQSSLFVVLIIFGYLLGSIPFGFIIAKLKKIDIRKQGSGATGATNVSRTLGLGYAILVAILDIAKAAIPIYIGYLYFAPGWQMALISIAPVIGHIFPVWLKFKGGKGFATMFASVLIVFGWKYSLLLIALWIVMLFLIRTMSLTNLIIVWLLPPLFWVKTHSLTYVLLGFFYITIIYWAHRENIKRLKQGIEPKLFKAKNQSNK